MDEMKKCGPRNGYAVCPAGQCCSSWGECGKNNCHMQEYENRTGGWRGKFDGKAPNCHYIITILQTTTIIPICLYLFLFFIITYAVYKCY